MTDLSRHTVDDRHRAAANEIFDALNSSGLSLLAQIAVLSNILGRLAVVTATAGTSAQSVGAVSDRNFAAGAREAHGIMADELKRRAH